MFRVTVPTAHATVAESLLTIKEWKDSINNGDSRTIRFANKDDAIVFTEILRASTGAMLAVLPEEA